MNKNTVPLCLALSAALCCAAMGQDVSFDKLYGGGLRQSVAGVSAPAPSKAAPAVEADKQDKPAEREWLVMVFINGRNNLWPAAIMDVNEMETVGSDSKVAIAVELGLLQDRGTSSRFLVEKDNKFPGGESNDTNLKNIVSTGVKVPDADMGSWKHFVEFGKWAMRKYPARRTMVVLWNHGSGRADIGGADNSGAELGIAYDDTTRNFIRNRQIAQALKELSGASGKKINILATDACLMQMASVVDEVKDRVEMIVGAEEIVPGNGFPYDTILKELASSPGMDSEALSRVIVEKFSAYYDAHQEGLAPNAGTTMSAIRASQVSGFNQVLNVWLREAIKDENAPAAKKALSDTLSFEYGYNGPDTGMNARSKDLYDFIEKMNAEPKASAGLKAKGQAVQKFIAGKLVAANATTGPNGAYSRAKGLAVYFPRMIYDSSYDETRFAADTLWDEFIKKNLEREQK